MSTLKLIGRLAVFALAAALAFSATAAKRDFDGDGKADLLWHSVHPIDTYAAIWLMDGGSPVNGVILGSSNSPGWPFIATSDLNGDGTHDIVVNVQDLNVSIRLMQGTTTLGSVTLGYDFGGGLLLADFDGDRRADIVLYDWLYGVTEVLLMDGLTVKSDTLLLKHDWWSPAFAADFNGDGKSDLVWRNSATGETAIWLMDGANYASGAIVMANASWMVIPAGDLDGDGKDDLAWRNNVTGETALWLMDGTSMTAGSIVVADGNWSAKHFGDLNGDGQSDIVWENSVTHATHVWLMNGLTMANGGPVPLNGASVIVVDDFDGDGRDDLVTSSSQSAPGFTTYSLWLMDGLNVKSMAALMDSNYWTIVPMGMQGNYLWPIGEP